MKKKNRSVSFWINRMIIVMVLFNISILVYMNLRMKENMRQQAAKINENMLELEEKPDAENKYQIVRRNGDQDYLQVKAGSKCAAVNMVALIPDKNVLGDFYLRCGFRRRLPASCLPRPACRSARWP